MPLWDSECNSCRAAHDVKDMLPPAEAKPCKQHAPPPPAAAPDHRAPPKRIKCEIQ